MQNKNRMQNKNNSDDEWEKVSVSPTPKPDICKICYVNQCDNVNVPCGHVIACDECLTQLPDVLEIYDPFVRKDYRKLKLDPKKERLTLNVTECTGWGKLLLSVVKGKHKEGEIRINTRKLGSDFLKCFTAKQCPICKKTIKKVISLKEAHKEGMEIFNYGLIRGKKVLIKWDPTKKRFYY